MRSGLWNVRSIDGIASCREGRTNWIGTPLLDEVAGYLPRSVLLSQRRDRFDGAGLVLELAFVLNDDVLAVRRARERACELGGFESA